jgi:hypothetical protein
VRIPEGLCFCLTRPLAIRPLKRNTARPTTRRLRIPELCAVGADDALDDVQHNSFLRDGGRASHSSQVNR